MYQFTLTWKFQFYLLKRKIRSLVCNSLSQYQDHVFGVGGGQVQERVNWEFGLILSPMVLVSKHVPIPRNGTSSANTPTPSATGLQCLLSQAQTKGGGRRGDQQKRILLLEDGTGNHTSLSAFCPHFPQLPAPTLQDGPLDYKQFEGKRECAQFTVKLSPSSMVLACRHSHKCLSQSLLSSDTKHKESTVALVGLPHTTGIYTLAQHTFTTIYSKLFQPYSPHKSRPLSHSPCFWYLPAFLAEFTLIHPL